MEIKKIEFLTSYAGAEQVPNWHLPEIAVVGRSNVGKSSFINTITNRKSIAKVSSKPGKTRLINYFVVNSEFILVDLPGYGFAKRSKKEKEQWQKLMTRYFKYSPSLKYVIIIIDAKVGITELDMQMIEFLKFFNYPYYIILNKSDKLKQKEKSLRLKEVKKLFDDSDYQFFSSLKRDGVNKFLEFLDSILGGY